MSYREICDKFAKADVEETLSLANVQELTLLSLLIDV